MQPCITSTSIHSFPALFLPSFLMLSLSSAIQASSLTHNPYFIPSSPLQNRTVKLNNCRNAGYASNWVHISDLALLKIMWQEKRRSKRLSVSDVISSFSLHIVFLPSHDSLAHLTSARSENLVTVSRQEKLFRGVLGSYGKGS
jgi:hypothetical protein